MRGTRRRSAYGRTAKVGVGALSAALLTFAITSPGGAAPTQDTGQPFGNGSGTAIAEVYKANPLFGNLSFGITVGESVAGHQNTAATGQSQSIDLGVIGVTLAAAGCDGADPTLAASKQPQAVIVQSSDPGAAQGKTAKEGGAITQFASATTSPFATASTEIGPVGEQAGVFLSGGKAVATSGIPQPGVRQAKAVTDIGKVSLLGGLVTLNGLHWDATQETGGRTTNSGTFTLGSIKILGQAIPLPADGLSALDSAQQVLNSLGITISRPQTRVASGVVFVDPLRIGVVPSQLRDNIISTLLGQLQPVRQSLTDTIAKLSCDGQLNVLGNNGSTLVTVLDLALGDVSGAGSLTVELGGVQATTAAITQFQGLGDIPPLNNGSTDSSLSPDLSGIGSTTGGTDLGSLPVDIGTGTTGGTAPSIGKGTSNPTKPIANVNGSRGGTLAAVGVAGLLLLLATAEADRRKMRRAQREISMED